MDSKNAGGIKRCSTQLQYIDVTIPDVDYKARLTYENNASPTTDEFKWYATASDSTPNMRLTTSGIFRKWHGIIK